MERSYPATFPDPLSGPGTRICPLHSIKLLISMVIGFGNLQHARAAILQYSSDDGSFRPREAIIINFLPATTHLIKRPEEEARKERDRARFFPGNFMKPVGTSFAEMNLSRACAVQKEETLCISATEKPAVY